MKRHKLTAEPIIDFELIGLTCTSKDFRMAWIINQTLNIRLVRQKDYEIVNSSQKKIMFTNYIFKSEHLAFRLFKNRSISVESFSEILIPEARHFDFILKIKGLNDEADSIKMLEKLRDRSEIVFAERLDPEVLKSKINLIS